jgi:dTDP-4-amino-4,6-dideoxygalactose transaminase
MNPHKVTEIFEEELANYCGAPYAVATTSCTMAILLACAYHIQYTEQAFHRFSIPKRTYCSVPQSIINAGGIVEFRDQEWIGEYEIRPWNIWDCARWLRSYMYKPGTMMCLSFHWSKHLDISQGGAILLDDINMCRWLKKARFDGRTPGVAPIDDKFDMIGWHAYMSPSDAAEGLTRLALLPKYNDPLPNSDYPDLSQFEVFNGQ